MNRVIIHLCTNVLFTPCQSVCALLTNLSSASPDVTWNSDKPELAIAPPFLTRRPWLRTAARIRRSATGSSSPLSSPRSLGRRSWVCLIPTAPRPFPRPLTVLGASRSANDLARCPRCKCRMWKMCFSSEGWVAYARRCEAKALRAISTFYHSARIYDDGQQAEAAP